MSDFFQFLAEIECPFAEKDLVSKDLKTEEPGWLVFSEKGYKIKIYALFNLINVMKVEVEKADEESDAVVKFDEVTKALVYRAFQSDKNKSDITSTLTSTAGLKEGSKKRGIDKKKQSAVINILMRTKTKKEKKLDVDGLMIKHLAAIILQ